jgi:arylsulfatase A-like enzyme
MKQIIAAILLAAVSSTIAQEKPNILWITSEDNSISWISCYGSKNAKTPNIDTLATEGFRYKYCFDNAAVCAPTRYTWLSGMHAISCGTQEMRSGAEIPADVVYYNKQLQKAGYYTSNCQKTDYNLRSGDNPGKYWDYSGGDYASTWKKRKAGQPFFTVYNIGQSHESRAFGNLSKDAAVRPEDMTLHSYHPDIPEMRETYAIYANSVQAMDEKVGEAIAKLKADGLYEDTIIVYNSDHGGVLPRSKRFLYASGVHCPLIVRIPEKWKHLYPKGKTPGDTVDRIVSFVDMPKTWISLAGGEVPDVYQGRIFLGADIEPEKAYHFSWRGRADARFDCVRMVRNERYAYHKNYAPFAPAGQYLAYMHNMKGTDAWEKYHKAGKTNAVTGRFFEPRVSEELYDNDEDFDNINNLIGQRKYAKIESDLKAEMRRQQLAAFDSGLLPERIRNDRAKAHGMTVYQMVRDAKIYPLEKYLDTADISLARDKKNLSLFVKNLTDKDLGMQYWAVVGLLLLEKDAAPAIGDLQKTYDRAVADRTPYLAPYAAWAIFRAGNKALGEELLHKLLEKDYKNANVGNVMDWMGDDAHPLLKRFTKGKLLAGSITKDVVDRSGIPALNDSNAKVIQASAFPDGVKAEYYKQKDCRGDVVRTETVKNIRFEWKNGAPDGLPADNFSVRFTGKLKAAESGLHVIVSKCDDGARLWLDGKPVYDGWGNNKSGLLTLEAGKTYDIKMEYTENARGAYARLMWIQPSQIPAELK